MNKKKLQHIMRENEDSYRKLAKKLDISLSAFAGKMNSLTLFNQKEIKKIKDLYDLTAKEIDEIFFN